MQIVSTFSRWRWPIGLLAVALAVTLVSYFLSYSIFRQAEMSQASDRAAFYRTMLVNALNRFEYLPLILAQDGLVIAGAQQSDRAALNARLAQYAQQADVAAIYLIDTDGLTIAASNYADEVTFLGQYYLFRPYFQTAVRGVHAEFFAIGTTSLKPGYFIAEPVRSVAGDIVSVIVVKVDLNPLTEVWRDGGEQVFVSNKDGIVVLSSNPQWSYKALSALSQEQRAVIGQQRQFSQQALQPLADYGWAEGTDDIRKLSGDRYFYVRTDVARNDWILHFLSAENNVRTNAYFVSVILAVVLSLGLAWALFVRSQRIRAALHDSQLDRRQLRKVNANLAREIEDRQAAEKRLARAQKELAQTSRLAALGHLSASVTHELGQPISAMRNYLAAAEIDPETEDLPKLITALSGIARRMENTTEQLKFFAKPGNAALEKIDVVRVLDGALEMLAPQLRKYDIALGFERDADIYFVRGNQLRLEQVMINVLRNACNALMDIDDRAINIDVHAAQGQVFISVRDNGNGLEGLAPAKLFEPFFTTRASGDGMGLGLAISSAIVKEHDGQISAENIAEGGAKFVIELPQWSEQL